MLFIPKSDFKTVYNPIAETFTRALLKDIKSAAFTCI